MPRRSSFAALSALALLGASVPAAAEGEDAVERNLCAVMLGTASRDDKIHVGSVVKAACRGRENARATIVAVTREFGVDGAPLLDALHPQRRESARRVGTDFATALLTRLYREAVGGEGKPEGLRRLMELDAGRGGLAHELAEVLEDGELRAWIELGSERVRRAQEIALAVAPLDLSPRQNEVADAALRAFSDWEAYPYALIIVPGYTPLDAKQAKPGVYPKARRRLERAARDFRAGLAPFVLLSGSNVYPHGTPFYEALEMKRVLLDELEVPHERILVDTRARHTTTNLRNAGRYMLARGLTKALVTTTFGQDFYLSHPEMSGFHLRCESELGYRVGRFHNLSMGPLGVADPEHVEFQPAPEVVEIGWRDPQDP